jgi:hypothetical protein
MTLTVSTLTSIWCGLFLAVLLLAGVRKWVSRREDDTVHLADGEVGLVRYQAWIAIILKRVDRWGKALTAVVLLYGLAIIARVLYTGWVESSQIK